MDFFVILLIPTLAYILIEQNRAKKRAENIHFIIKSAITDALTEHDKSTEIQKDQQEQRLINIIKIALYEYEQEKEG